MLQEILSNLTLTSILAVLNSFLLVYLLIPKIYWVIDNLHLNDNPDERSSHAVATPTMAGISFFITLIMTLFFIQQYDTEHISIHLIAASTLIFIVGLKDDLVLSAPRAKILVEALAILFLFFSGAMQVATLHGFLGVHGIPTIVSYVLIIIMLLTIINAFNLIDGIDGLASHIAVVIFSVFALIFYIAELYFYFLVSVSLIGMLLSYLFYNFSHTKKIFMGDTGSLLIGFCIGFCTLKFLAMDASLFTRFTFHLENKLFIIAAILCVPLFDLFRVIGIRLLQKKSPFYPDRNHVHHVLIDTGLSHYKTTIILGVFNYVMVIFVLYLSAFLNSFQMFGVLGLIFIVLLVVLYMLKKNSKLLKASKELEKKLEAGRRK